MSVGGVFKLITNSGQADRYLVANELLMARIAEMGKDPIKMLRKQYPNKTTEELMKMDNTWKPTINIIDRTHTIFTMASFKPFVAFGLEYLKSEASGPNRNFGDKVTFTLPNFGQFVNDCVVHVQISAFSAVTPGDKIRWCEFPGHRLFKNVSFSTSNATLDEYGSDEYNAFYAFKLPVGKEAGYLKMVGQEVPYVGYLTPDPSVDEFREYRVFGSGPQTYKQTQPQLDLWIPLLFWFREVNSSLPNFVIPFGQTNITIEMESLSRMVSYAANVGDGSYTTPTIEKLELYSNNIFFSAQVFDILQSKFTSQLIRVHKKNEVKSVSQASGTERLNKLVWPIESLFIAFRPQSNLTNSQLWAHYAVCTQQSIPEAVVNSSNVIQVNDAIYYSETSAVTTMSLVAQGIPIFNSTPYQFYNAYLPYRYGPTWKTPAGLGWFYMNFCVDPTLYNPNGYLNVSRAREFYLNFESTYISTSNLVDMIVLADCMNFLLISDGVPVLRYIT